jgi:autotransporter-associated beta strand protein
VPVDTNGFILDADTGGGNGGHVASGPISGTGSFVITHGPAGGAWDNIYTISGATPNTYTGPTLLKRGTIRMAKTAGVDALPPGTVPITLGMAGDTARLVWGASNQINDAAAITVLLPTVTVAAADANLNFLNLAGFSDTIAALTLPDDGTKTQIRTGTGGVLTVTTLTVNGIVMGSGTYTEANSTFVKGTGSVVVPGAGTTYNSWKVAHAGGQTAGEDFDNDGVSNGVEYFMNAPDGFTANPGVVAGKVTWPHVNPVASFVVQVSDNLTNWVPADPADIDTTTDPTKVVYTLPTGAAKKFCRLFVTP